MRAVFGVVLLGVMGTGCAALPSSIASLVPGSASASHDTEGTPTTLLVVNPSDDPLDQSSGEHRTVTVSQHLDAGALHLTIDEVEIHPRRLAIALTITNPTERRVRFYPNQGYLVARGQTLDVNIFLTDASLSGGFDPGETRSGHLVFSAAPQDDLELTDLKGVRVVLGPVLDMISIDPHEVRLALSLQP